MQQQDSIPLYIVEEHHEAFYAWYCGVQRGYLHPENNCLVHIDEHSDMTPARCRYSLHQLNGDLNAIKQFTYTELAIDTFISAAIYRGLFNRMHWIRQRHEGASVNQSIAMYFRSGNNDGKKLVLGRRSEGSLHENIGQELNIRYFDYCRQHVEQLDEDLHHQDIVLDIDLDYFSCTGQPNKQQELWIEISQDEFERFRSNRYHPLQFRFSRVELAMKEEKYYYLINNYDEIYLEETYVSLHEIQQRVDLVIDTLRQRNIRPKLITLCRSRFSGYTPPDQWEMIEVALLKGLQTIYPLNPVPVHLS